MEDLTLNITDDIQYVTERRDAALERFIEKLKANNSTPEEMHKALDVVLRINKQVKTLQDCLIIAKVAKKE
jgi:hypothetical protein